ncbi:MAG: ATP-binding cassette domain-containing protein [Eggerthella lenta]
MQGCQDIDFAIEPASSWASRGAAAAASPPSYAASAHEPARARPHPVRLSALRHAGPAQATQRQMLYLRAYELGYVSQFLNALPRQTAYDIVLKSALEAYGADERSRAEEETERMLRHFDLDEGLWELYPRTFSGGEKLRLNIAAAMIKRPRLLLLDEPTASLDNASKLKVRSLIEQLKAEGTTMLGIFHDLEFMEGLCDHEFNMQEGMMA